MNKWYRIVLMIFVVIFSFIVITGYGSSYINYFNQPKVAKRLAIGSAGDPIGLDPINTTELNSVKVSVNIFETLVKYEKDGNNIVPCLAESWKSSEDGLVWDFRLRQGVRFHDGTVFDAHAVEFNFQRWMNTKNPYHNGQFSYWNYIFGGFPGFVTSVTAVSDYTVEIRLSKPYAPFLSALSMPVFGIASPAAIKKYGAEISRHPVGTGPFVFKSWDPNKSIVLVRNDKYWAVPAKVDEVEFRVISSSQDRLEELKQGKIQIADNLGPDDAAVIQNDPDLQLLLRPCFNVGYIAVNNLKYPFNRREVRLAMNMAIDKEKMVKEVFSNLARPAESLIPPLLWGYNESIEPYEYNVQKAKELLAEGGFPHGFKTTLWVMNCSRDYFPKPIQVAEYIKDSLKQINIDVTIQTFNWDEYLNRIGNGEHELALIGWTGDNIDPDNFLYTLLSSENAKPGLTGNYSFYRNAEVDLLLKQARQSTNMVFRKNLYRKLLETVNYDMPTVPLVHTMPVLAARLSVKGYTPYITGVDSLENVDVDLEY